MADPTKHGFWQTIPGMMTASAGILSAATGMLVALNQTGFVDLRQMAGGKPAAQSSSLGTPSPALRTEDNPSKAIPETEKSTVEAKTHQDQAVSAPRVQDLPARPPLDAADRRVEAKLPESTAPSGIHAGGARIPAPETERRVVVESTTLQEPSPSVWPAREKPMQPKPIPERVAEVKRPQELSPTSVARPVVTKEPGADIERKAGPTISLEERAPSAASAQRDGTLPRSDTPARMAEARRKEEPPMVKQPSNHDVKKSEALRQRPEESRVVGKAKALATEPSEKKHPETASEAKKDKRQFAQADIKQPGKPLGSSTAPSTKDAAPAKGTPLRLAGLTLTVPGSWTKEEVPRSPMGPVAVFKIPKSDPGGEDGAVRITHYPNMKGKDKDEMNIERWIGQVAKADGTPSARSDAKITTTEIGPVRLTVVDLSGSVKMTMRDAAKPDQRMIAAIVDHPQGPHFVVTAGPTAAMEKWAPQIDAFLKSAKTD